MKHVIVVGLSPTLQKTILFDSLKIGGVNRSAGYRVDASGKAVNAARVLAQLGGVAVANVCPLGAENASFFLELASSDGLEVDFVEVPGRVRYCYTLVAGGASHATELVVSEPSASADYAAVAESLLARVAEKLDEADALVLAGSRPSFWPEDLYARICALAKESGRVLIADFHGKDLELALSRAVPDIVKINEEEFSGTFGYAFPLSERELAGHLAEKSAFFRNTIVVTRGEKDVFAASQGKAFRRPVMPVRVLNAIGCGDAFTAGFIHSWLMDDPSLEANRDDEGMVARALERGIECASRNALSLRPGSIRDADAEGEGPL